MDEAAEPFILGRREWVSLPDLGLHAIKAKVDTGARTSALHAYAIEPFGAASAPRVRFRVHPLLERPEVEVLCEAALLGARDVTSSSGETENRFIIETTVKIGSRAWRIDGPDIEPEVSMTKVTSRGRRFTSSAGATGGMTVTSM